MITLSENLVPTAALNSNNCSEQEAFEAPHFDGIHLNELFSDFDKSVSTVARIQPLRKHLQVNLFKLFLEIFNIYNLTIIKKLFVSLASLENLDNREIYRVCVIYVCNQVSVNGIRNRLLISILFLRIL